MFIFIFLSEYSNIIVLTGLLSILFIKIKIILWLFLLLSLLVVRACYARIRYDVVINMSWLLLFPILINSLIINFIYKFL